MSERDLVLGVSGLDGRLPIVQRRQEGLLGEGVVEDARLLRNSSEDGVDVALARVAQKSNNFASSLCALGRFEEAKTLWRTSISTARRILGEAHDLTLTMRINYTRALYSDTGAALGDIREAVTTLEDTARIARRVLGGSHPLVAQIELGLRDARAALCARETQP